MAEENLEKATFAGGCFWRVEEVFRQVKGVKSTTVGYTGGDMPNPTYEKVCSGKTGHAEAVEVVWDPREISYEKLLEIFFASHDPTQVNRQPARPNGRSGGGPDIGEQYRSEIFYHTPEQKKLAEKFKAKIPGATTQIVPAEKFWKAEEYHQRYLEKKRARID